MEQIIQKEITQVIKRIELLAKSIDTTSKDSEALRRDLISLKEQGGVKEKKSEVVSKLKTFTELQTNIGALSQSYAKNVFFIQELLKIAALVGLEPEIDAEFEKSYPSIKEMFKDLVSIDTEKNEVSVNVPTLFSKELEDVSEEVVLSFLNNPLFQSKK
jgi:predicted  nucleic acid-binding Zn-ribbon protein